MIIKDQCLLNYSYTVTMSVTCHMFSPNVVKFADNLANFFLSVLQQTWDICQRRACILVFPRGTFQGGMFVRSPTITASRSDISRRTSTTYIPRTS